MFKHGDDLRQDQLIMQMIILMDTILKKYGLDMKLSPYKVLATSLSDGFVEFVPNSKNLSTVLAEHNNDILQYLRRKEGASPADEGVAAVDPAVLDTYIRSCAGYCVITYILGIGDRHLDNLLITQDGHLFHIDFGFILGKDPKPFPPPMKLCREMVEAMGGQQSAGYNSFRSKACQAFKILRRNAKLILNLLTLMVDANIKDLAAEGPVAILKVSQKFRPDLNDEQAEAHFLQLINESTSALFPIVF